MKRLLMSAAASLVLAAAFASPALAQQPQHEEHHNHGGNPGSDHGGGQPHGGAPSGAQPGGEHREVQAAPQGRNFGGGQPRAEETFQARPGQSGRDFGNRTVAQNFDRGRDNRGFAPDRRGEDFRAAPRADYRSDRGRPAFDRGYPRDPRFAGDWRSHRWVRGEYLGSYSRYYVDFDWRPWGYAAPAYGCRYVEDDFGDILLVDIATGMVLQVIAAG